MGMSRQRRRRSSRTCATCRRKCSTCSPGGARTSKAPRSPAGASQAAGLAALHEAAAAGFPEPALAVDDQLATREHFLHAAANLPALEQRVIAIRVLRPRRDDVLLIRIEQHDVR